jgi:hypothetical protein
MIWLDTGVDGLGAWLFGHLTHLNNTLVQSNRHWQLLLSFAHNKSTIVQRKAGDSVPTFRGTAMSATGAVHVVTVGDQLGK